MCPFERHTMVAGPDHVFGPPKPVFSREISLPCAIHIRDKDLQDELIVQVRKDDGEWKEYIPGEMIIAKTIECRMTVKKPEVNVVEVDVLHN